MITSDTKYKNHLINENSPYLLQHAHNPVDWYPWGEEAFEKAQKENKLILVSIGYAACHWCHVMEHESFEDEAVAAIMNEHFVCIKVDREERPDIDQVYMNAVQLLTQHGGWPLNCFALPNGKPVYGGTYFPKKNWMEVLLSLHDIYTTDYEKVLEQANAVAEGLSDIIPLVQTESTTNTFNKAYTEKYFKALAKMFDPVWGGSKGAPKFPMPVVYEFLLRYYFQTKNPNVIDDITLLLDKMALGGIYDHLGGGFARYSTDERWFVPHFEKMLYDNAQLISLYSKTYKIVQKEQYKNVIIETLDFVERELTSPDGAFYSSIDADSDGEEGKFYVWKRSEVDEILGERSKLFCDYYQIGNEGNWEEGKNILYLKHFPEQDNELQKELVICKNLLFCEREKRIHPGLDSKILCSWNALMLEAYLDAYTALQITDYYEKALTNAAYLEENLVQKGKVWRVNQNGKTIHGFLDDYAFTAKALIRLFQVSCNEKWLQMARLIIDRAVEIFIDKETGLFFYTSAEDPPLTVRKHELHDNVTPASNSVMAMVLFQLGRYYEHELYREMAFRMLGTISAAAIEFAWYHAGWARLACDLAYPSFEVAITGPDAKEKVLELESNYLPHVLVCGSPTESFLPLLDKRFKPGETWLYVCENQTCKLPVNKVEVVMDYVTKEYFL